MTTDDRTGGRRRALDSEGKGTMPEEHENSAPGDGLPWGFILDPAANRRALGDVQERGLRAARDLADGSSPRSPPPSGHPPVTIGTVPPHRTRRSTNQSSISCEPGQKWGLGSSPS